MGSCLTRNIDLDKRNNINPQDANDFIGDLLEKQNFNMTELQNSNILLINKLRNHNIKNLKEIILKREKIENDISKLNRKINNFFNEIIKKNTGILNNNNLTLIQKIKEQAININKSFQIMIEMIKKHQSIFEQNLNLLYRDTKVLKSYTCYNRGYKRYEVKV